MTKRIRIRPTKAKLPKIATQQSVAFKHQMAVGSAIGAQLPQFATRVAVGKALGISGEMVRRIENQALFKVQQALRNALQEYLA